MGKCGDMNMAVESSLDPRSWLRLLGETIKETKGKIGSSSVSFDQALDKAITLFRQTSEARKSIWWIGNGGSAGICSHLSQDVMNKLKTKSVYTGDASLLTCVANDFGYEKIYSKPLEQLADAGDLLVAISSSGNSENIVSCLRLAEKKQIKVISLSGMKENNRLWNSNFGVAFFCPSTLYGIVEVSHEAILHGIIETLWLESLQPASGILE